MTAVALTCATGLTVNGTWGTDEDTLGFDAIFAVCGPVVLAALAWIAGDGAAVRRFARANGLEVAQHGLAPHHAGSAFSAETHMVCSAVRPPQRRTATAC